MNNIFQKALILIFVLCFVGCVKNGQHPAKSKGGIENQSARKISIYLYEDFPIQKARVLCRELEKYFPQVELMEVRRSLPQEAYVKNRNRYRGTGLLDDLRKIQDDNTVIGLTDKIICIKNEISPDFGIMGVSYRKSGLCAASSTIPKNGKQQTDSNFVKLTLHELGHAYGLPHCPDQKCYMVDAEHKMKLHQTTGFCEKCYAYLKSAGLKRKQ
ncbi:MAG: hypothetical protein K2K97_00020 [Muribaculaceae bacterium]|nr:hypothetical protein [Muribaculaceae bacterium]